jgi:hypothetical protein
MRPKSAAAKKCSSGGFLPRITAAFDEVVKNLHDPGWAEDHMGNPAPAEEFLRPRLDVDDLEPPVLLAYTSGGDIRDPIQVPGRQIDDMSHGNELGFLRQADVHCLAPSQGPS